MYLFRYPAGIFSEQSLGILDKCGYTGVFWSFAYHDWDPENQMGYEEALKKKNEELRREKKQQDIEKVKNVFKPKKDNNNTQKERYSFY
mgnify:CR=1 FL=1